MPCLALGLDDIAQPQPATKYVDGVVIIVVVVVVMKIAGIS